MSVNTFKSEPDFGPYEVRTASYHHYGLLIRPNELDYLISILVVGQRPHFQIAGWLLTGHAKQLWWRYDENGRDPCWIVPQRYLHSIRWLKENGPHLDTKETVDPFESYQRQ
jgi:hypothetical protein